MSLEDLDSVLDQAVRAYMVAKKRSLLQRPRHPSEDFDAKKGMTVQDLAPQHPAYDILWGTEPKIKFVGISAAEVLENYLAKLGYPRGSDLWFSMAQIVRERGEIESEMGFGFHEDS